MPKVLGMPGHAWRDVVHENAVQWIATFEDGLLGDAKYVSFAATSGLKGQPDMLKYDRARRLVATIDKIRASYEKLQHSSSAQKAACNMGTCVPGCLARMRPRDMPKKRRGLACGPSAYIWAFC